MMYRRGFFSAVLAPFVVGIPVLRKPVSSLASADFLVHFQAQRADGLSGCTFKMRVDTFAEAVKTINSWKAGWRPEEIKVASIRIGWVDLTFKEPTFTRQS